LHENLRGSEVTVRIVCVSAAVSVELALSKQKCVGRKCELWVAPISHDECHG